MNQVFIPKPPPEGLESQVRPSDWVSNHKSAQASNPLLVIDKLAGSGIEYRFFQIVQNKEGKVGVAVKNNGDVAIQIGTEFFKLEGEWAKENIVGSEQRLLPVGPADYAPKQGWYTYYAGVPFPRKAFVYPEAIEAINVPKRAIICLLRFFSKRIAIPLILTFVLLPKRFKIRLIEEAAEQFREFTRLGLNEHFVDDKFKLPVTLATHKLIETFLMEYGIHKQQAEYLAKIGSHVMEYDDAYRYIVQDTITAVTSLTEVQKMLEVVNERSEGKPKVKESFNKFGKVLLLILKVPSVRRAFKKACDSVDIKDFQFDEIDLFNVSRMADYKFMGLDVEERFKKHGAEFNAQAVILQ